VAVAALPGAVRVVVFPLVGLTLPAEVLHVIVPFGAPAMLIATSSPTPIVVRVRLLGVVATVWETSWTVYKVNEPEQAPFATEAAITNEPPAVPKLTTPSGLIVAPTVLGDIVHVSKEGSVVLSDVSSVLASKVPPDAQQVAAVG
jgi:hypothetical protein